MPLKSYGVLKARPVDRRLCANNASHYQILALGAENYHRVAVNVKSALAPSELEYWIAPHFTHPITTRLENLAAGWHPVLARPGGLALDYLRADLLSLADLTPLQFAAPGLDNDLNEKIDAYVQRALASSDAWLFAFGEPWGPERKRDPIFGFAPGRGVHDLHMNQGNVSAFVQDDGVWQDGGLLFWFPGQRRWVALFLKFQSQAVRTDALTGHALIQ